MKRLILCLLLIVCLLCSATIVQASEVRTVFVSGFRLDISCIELTDEDGYIWLFGLSECDLALYDEFILVLPEDGEPELYSLENEI